MGLTREEYGKVNTDYAFEKKHWELLKRLCAEESKNPNSKDQILAKNTWSMISRMIGHFWG